jgi:aldose 1-epimerase
LIGQGLVNKIPVVALATGEPAALEATFAPSAGMVGCSLRHRGEELLGQRGGLRTYIAERSTMGIPFLHPWANRLSRTRFTVAGGEVDLGNAATVTRDSNGLPMHGLLNAAKGWRVEKHEAIEDGGLVAASFRFSQHHELMAAFPFPHDVLLEAILQNRTLTVRTTVAAAGDRPVPVSFGYHPYLRLPDLDRSRWEIEIPVSERLELDDRMLPTGGRTAVRVEPGPLGSKTFDDAYMAAGPDLPFVLAGGGRRIELSMGDGYRFAQVYAPPGDEVIAYEPMTAPTNALVNQGPDLPLLQPGERYEAIFSITVA